MSLTRMWRQSSAPLRAKLGSDIVNEQKRFFAIKLLEKDDKITEQMKSVPDVSAEIKQLEDKLMTIPRVLLQTSVTFIFQHHR